MRLLKTIKDSDIIKLDPKVVYLTMELGFSPEDYFNEDELNELNNSGNTVPEYLRMYNGGLGVLAGDIAKSATDLGIPIAFVLPYYAKGFGKQKVTEQGDQDWDDNPLDTKKNFQNLEDIVEDNFGSNHLEINGRYAWLIGQHQGEKHAIPIGLLDYSHAENPSFLKDAQYLYRGNELNKLCQEVTLGVLGVKLARKKWPNVEKFHLNDSHPGFAVVELLYEQLNKNIPFDNAVKNVRKQVGWTTHTPVSAAWHKYPYDMVAAVFGGNFREKLEKKLREHNPDKVSLGFLALWGAGYINAVSKQNAIVAQTFDEVKSIAKDGQKFVSWVSNPPVLRPSEWTIDNITNGIYHPGWTSAPNKKLFSSLGNWIDNPTLLADAPRVLEDDKVWEAHIENKRLFFEYLNIDLDVEALTFGFARRFAIYKRAALMVSNENRLKNIARDWYTKSGKPLQIIMAGIAHPEDEEGKAILKEVYQKGQELNKEHYIKFVFMPNYRISNARVMIPGVDGWVDTPFRPYEASGTSGMKAAINGVLNLSVLDGWWPEGYKMRPESGWVIGGPPQNYVDDSKREQFAREDADSLYTLLEHEVPHMYYRNRPEWIYRMKQAIALGSYFNTHRVVVEYAQKAWGLSELIKKKGLEYLLKPMPAMVASKN